MEHKNFTAEGLIEMVNAINQHRKPNQYYVEVFFNSISLVPYMKGNIIAQVNYFQVQMWDALFLGWFPPVLTEEQYTHIKNNLFIYPACLVGWAGTFCGICTWFGTFDNERQMQAREENTRLVEHMETVQLQSTYYFQTKIPPQSIVFIAAPNYVAKENNNTYWTWIRKSIEKEQQTVFILAEKAPKDFNYIWKNKYLKLFTNACLP